MRTELEFWTEERDRLAALGGHADSLAIAVNRLRELNALAKPTTAEPVAPPSRSMGSLRRFYAFQNSARVAELVTGATGEPEYTVAGNSAEVMLYGACDRHDSVSWYEPGQVFTDVGVHRVLEKLKGKNITLRVNSDGGEAFAGVAIANRVRRLRATAVVDGIAASIASVIVAACSKVTMANGATIMVHKPASYGGGNAPAHREEANVLDKVEESLLDIYVAKTGKRYSRAQWMAALAGPDGADGTWWTADEAVTVGIADAREVAAVELPEAKRAALADQRQRVAALYGSKLPAHLAAPAKAVANVSYLRGAAP